SAYRALTCKAGGPTLYDLCDPLLLSPDGGGDSHLRQFYKTALANAALRPLLGRAGLPQLRDEHRFHALRRALTAARDDAQPDWRAIGTPLAGLLDEFPQQHPRPPAAPAPSGSVSVSRMDRIIRACGAHLIGSFGANDFIPAYAAFNLVGDPDFRGRDLITALAGLNARSYKNATLLFNLARVFLLANPHAAGVMNPPWSGLAEMMWSPVQIRHRSAYYDAFFAEALMDYLDTGLASADETAAARRAIDRMVHFCLKTSREHVRAPESGRPFDVITALVPPPHSRMSKFFWQLKSDLGFGVYVPDCDTTACSFSAATKFGSQDDALKQPLPDFYAEYQTGHGNHKNPATVAINDNIAFDGGVVTWIENLAGDRPYGNDLDPTLNLDVLEVSFLNHERWQIVENPKRLDMLRRIVRFQDRLADTGAFANPRSHIYYLPELYCAYFGRCYEAFRALPPAKQKAIDPDGSFELIRRQVLAYVRDDLLTVEINVFDAALALLALAKLDADPESFAPALARISASFHEGKRLLSFPPAPLAFPPFKAYEWNKMKTPTRILVGGPEVTSAFVLSALAAARKRLTR
ncbi:MAG: hypothetical protein N2689_09130, partial [Verrucomicrobiae bacterium]|nr:hypothetical protein [Verrucomicrobiae bacterium]